MCLSGCSGGHRAADLESVELWRSDYGAGLKLNTAHYQIFTTLGDPNLLRQVPRFMEAAYRGYNGELPESIETRHKFTIYLFANRREWEDFTRAFTGERAELFCKIKAGAYCHNGVCVTYKLEDGRTLSALGHEGWHQFSGRHFAFRLPSWLDEGIAMLFEHYVIKGGEFYFEPAGNTYRLNGLAATLRENRVIRLRDLLATSPGEVLATDEANAVTAFYSQSYALARFLRESEFGFWRGDYRRLLKDGLTGDWPIDRVSRRIARDRNQPRTLLWNRIVGVGLFEKYIDKDIEGLERKYLAYCRTIVGGQALDTAGGG